MQSVPCFERRWVALPLDRLNEGAKPRSLWSVRGALPSTQDTDHVISFAPQDWAVNTVISSHGLGERGKEIAFPRSRGSGSVRIHTEAA